MTATISVSTFLRYPLFTSLVHLPDAHAVTTLYFSPFLCSAYSLFHYRSLFFLPFLNSSHFTVTLPLLVLAQLSLSIHVFIISILSYLTLLYRSWYPSLSAPHCFNNLTLPHCYLLYIQYPHQFPPRFTLPYLILPPLILWPLGCLPCYLTCISLSYSPFPFFLTFFSLHSIHCHYILWQSLPFPYMTSLHHTYLLFHLSVPHQPSVPSFPYITLLHCLPSLYYTSHHTCHYNSHYTCHYTFHHTCFIAAAYLTCLLPPLPNRCAEVPGRGGAGVSGAKWGQEAGPLHLRLPHLWRPQRLS